MHLMTGNCALSQTCLLYTSWENPVLVHWVDANWPGFLNQIREYYAARVVTTLETRGDPQYDLSLIHI